MRYFEGQVSGADSSLLDFRSWPIAAVPVEAKPLPACGSGITVVILRR